MIKRFYKSIFFTPYWFWALALLVFLFLLSYIYAPIYAVAKVAFWLWVLFTLVDFALLYMAHKIKAQRTVPEKLSNGDPNPIFLKIQNLYPFTIAVRIIDEIPVQFQKRDFLIEKNLKSKQIDTMEYQLRPVKRGEYLFGAIHVFVESPIRLVRRKYTFDAEENIPNYPSYLQLRKYSIMAATNRLHEYGLKKIRRIGHTMEFEQIKDYVMGDDIRNINWKATAKRNQLMVNQYQDEKSQPIYSVIDMGRVMQMPFEEMSLLDYAINATLVISNVALQKQDKAGMFTFCRKVDHMIAAEKRPAQMNLILEKLYALDTDFAESDFSRLYIDTKRALNQRSLLLLYTNFETLDALYRQLPYLQAINKNHLLVVIFFENTELKEILHERAQNTFQVFEKTIAEKFVYEKKLIVRELQKYGIQTILTTPQNLTIDTINKYLEIKARGLL